jgi:PhoH-like ATPase
MTMRKNYILDANILLHDPNSILQFKDNTVILPVGVIGEIDRFKREMTDRGHNARAVVRMLDGLRSDRSLAQGISLHNGGNLQVYCDRDKLFSSNGHHNGNGYTDLEILRVAAAIRKSEPDVPVVIVTKDINLRIRADAAGFRAEDYETDHVSLADLRAGQSEVLVSPAEFEHFRSDGSLPRPAMAAELLPNEYLLVRVSEPQSGSALARVSPDGQRLIALQEPEKGVWGVRPRNKEQYYAVDALMDERVQLVSLMGKAGTGKTLLALAAGLFLTQKRKAFRSMLVCRPVVPVGRDIGYLPGDITRKLDPWMKPIVDTVEQLIAAGGPVRGHHDYDGLMRSGFLEIQPLSYIRGRSIANRFVIIDESQNLTPLEVKTVITRIGFEAKVVLTGDPWQIDNPYVDANSNGFSYLINRFRGQPIAAYVELRKGERSPLADLAANLL